LYLISELFMLVRKKVGALNQKEQEYAALVANSWVRHCVVKVKCYLD